MINKKTELILNKIMYCVSKGKRLNLDPKSTKNLFYFIDDLVKTILNLQLELSRYDSDMLDEILKEEDD